MSDALDVMRALYDTGKYADMTIRCENKVFNVHRAVVCMRSPVIAAAMDGLWEEATQGEYHMQYDQLPIVEAMIYYLYHGTYNDGKPLQDELLDESLQLELRTIKATPIPPTIPRPPAPESALGLGEPPTSLANNWFVSGFGKPPSDVPLEATPTPLPSSLLFNAKVYIIADAYMIPELKDLAITKYKEGVETCWDTPEFSEAVKLLWENTVESDTLVRDAVVTAAASHKDRLLDRGDFVEFLSTHGDFGVALLKKGRFVPFGAIGKADPQAIRTRRY